MPFSAFHICQEFLRSTALLKKYLKGLLLQSCKNAVELKKSNENLSGTIMSVVQAKISINERLKRCKKNQKK